MKQLGETELGWITIIIIINKLLISLVGVVRVVWLGFLKSHAIYAGDNKLKYLQVKSDIWDLLKNSTTEKKTRMTL